MAKFLGAQRTYHNIYLYKSMKDAVPGIINNINYSAIFLVLD